MKTRIGSVVLTLFILSNLLTLSVFAQSNSSSEPTVQPTVSSRLKDLPSDYLDQKMVDALDSIPSVTVKLNQVKLPNGENACAFLIRIHSADIPKECFE